MTKDTDKRSWQDNYKNNRFSGIELRDASGKLVNFITIKHDEILDDKKTPHRIQIKVNENAEPILPPPQTFDEIIQAKRRYQTLLYGSGSYSTNSAVLSDRTAARRAAAAVVASAASISRRQVVNGASSSLPRRRPSGTNRRSSNSRRSKKKTIKPPQQPDLVSHQLDSNNETLPSTSHHDTLTVKSEPKSPQRHELCDGDDNVDGETTHQPMDIKSEQSQTQQSNTVMQNINDATSPGPTAQIVTSMKELNKFNPMLDSVESKKVKLLLKTALPGTTIVLPDGTVIKKSRRGGARAGAGRKRSRPLPPGSKVPTDTSLNGSQLHQQSISSTSSSFSSQ